MELQCFTNSCNVANWPFSGLCGIENFGVVAMRVFLTFPVSSTKLTAKFPWLALFRTKKVPGGVRWRVVSASSDVIEPAQKLGGYVNNFITATTYGSL